MVRVEVRHAELESHAPSLAAICTLKRRQFAKKPRKARRDHTDLGSTRCIPLGMNAKSKWAIA
jgi:hypothetical protein